MQFQESPVEIYEKAMKKKLNEYRVKTTRQKYAKKKAYQTFREAIHVSPQLLMLTSPVTERKQQEAQYPDKAIPPITEFIPKGALHIFFCRTITHFHHQRMETSVTMTTTLKWVV